ncbi:MAG: polyhydroxyalkanoic acid system family protein [Myxococcales bacterium]|nr:polyhydroxyalkanoic acid system family protein [Myxococcales bacterium]
MAKVNIEQAHALPLDEVKKRLQELADRLSTKYGIDAKWTSDREATLKRTGVSGTIKLAEDKVAVLLDLSFALLPMKGKIQERIARELKSALA